MSYLHFRPGLALGQALTVLAEDMECDYDPVILLLVGTGLEAYAITTGRADLYQLARNAIRDACERMGVPLSVEEFTLTKVD